MDTFRSLRDTHLVSMIPGNFRPPPILSTTMVTAPLIHLHLPQPQEPLFSASSGGYNF